jgi:CheY-like chemotaxis protein
VRRVLVVDDNHDAAESMRMLLQVLGHETRAAYDGNDAVAIAAEYRPDVVFLDLGMPGMDGYQLARALRVLPGFENVTLVALTGFGSEEHRRKTIEAGIDRHLVKPVELAALQRALAPREGAAAEPPRDA